MKLTTPLKEVLRTTKDHVDALSDMGMNVVEDLLLYLPRMHEDRSAFHTLTNAPADTKVTIRGTVESLKLVRTRRGKVLVAAKFTDSDGSIADVIWFNQPHIKRMLHDGQEVVLMGKLTEGPRGLTFQSPQFEVERSRDLVHAGRLVPVYPQHDVISTTWLREKMLLVKDAIQLLPETLPDDVLKEEELPSRRDAVLSMHFPDDPHKVELARKRFAFERMFMMQKDILQRKMEWQGERNDALRTPLDVELIKDLFLSLNFSPTGSQKVAIYEILKDMEKDVPMSRLLEGDVGSGKTLVATAVIANVIRHGGQCALMVPTEVLAKQHAQSIAKTLIAFSQFRLKQGRQMPMPSVALLTGSLPASDANTIRLKIANGTVDLIVGTHALIEDKVGFKSLRLVIVDEQHRFGVAQREKLKAKGAPHFLSMTATPIPRTLALTAYGHHDLSVLLEKPGNRVSIATKVVSPKDRKTVELFIDREISDGRQAFVICPLIGESAAEDMESVRNVTMEEKRLREEFPSRRIAALHGKMTPQEKDRIMREFKEKKFDILVSTSVIEVGIDVPNATIIVIEGAERFGLSQLHQFRGRVGRSDFKSHCFLFTTGVESARSPRLRAMEKYDSGFHLAEIDLKLRGPGELFGFRQSGIPQRELEMFMDPELAVRARRAAEREAGVLTASGAGA
ncbi:ATP-dependent DNA helicase RecG [Candidatus Peregrinibacteria bacterium]|nr:ATP-dependent DNA helicase RecG [Candidatus Peregrinibacteria bacterium]